MDTCNFVPVGNVPNGVASCSLAIDFRRNNASLSAEVERRRKLNRGVYPATRDFTPFRLAHD